MRVPDAALLALHDVARGAAADRALKRVLQRHPQLTNAERALVADVVMGVSCLQGRLRYQLEQAQLPTDAAHLTALYLVDERQAPADAELSVVERARLERTRFPDDPLLRLAAVRSLPLFLARRFLAERGPEEADALAAALNQRGPVTVRANSLKTTREDLAATLLEEGVPTRPGSLSPWALHLEGRANIHGSPSWRAGLFEVQDEGSQLIALATGARPGDVVIDYCAGRGGKSLALAAMLGNQGRVLAHDVDERRLRDLRPRRARAGAGCLEVVTDVRDLPRDADVVLVDAPCSETGALRRGPHNRWSLDEADLDELPRLQHDILLRAAAFVRRGGRLVYATCSLLKAENEDVVARFLSTRPAFSVVEARGLSPHEDGTDGFYIAALRSPS